MKNLLVLSLLLLLISCGSISTSQYQSFSSGAIGCDPNEIKILNEKNIVWAGSGVTWVAECKGKKYFCSYGGNTQCSEEKK